MGEQAACSGKGLAQESGISTGHWGKSWSPHGAVLWGFRQHKACGKAEVPAIHAFSVIAMSAQAASH